MKTDTDERYARLLALLKDVANVNAAKAALEWDMETKMPAGAGEARGDVIGTLASVAHEKLTSAEFEDAISPLIEQHRRGAFAKSDPAHAVIGLAWKRFDRERKLPSAHVSALASLCASSHHVWSEARAASDWQAFLPNLARIIAMKREEAGHVGYAASPYDALIDEFEPGMTSAKAAAVLDDLGRFLSAFVCRIADAGTPADPDGARVPLPSIQQEALSIAVAREIGFDFSAGRLDTAAHPFMTRLHLGDVRLTTRYDERNLIDCLYSVVHEAGHGMYEQGLPAELYGTPAGEAASFGLHESQSRLWENMVGKSLPFCLWLAEFAGAQGIGIGDARRFHRGLNAVVPSLVRVDADEVTYNLHVCLRFGIERDLIEGRLDPKDVPEAWNEGMRTLLGVEVPTAALGALQDIHWSGGSFGYFPSYAIGNVYAAQLYGAAARALPGLEDGFRKGEFASLLTWLRENVHRHGSCKTAEEIVRDATGAGLSVAPFVAYVERKFGEIYGL